MNEETTIPEGLTCDHCESSMDDPIQGMRGEYCSSTCYYAEEMGEIHDDHDTEACPGCSA